MWTHGSVQAKNGVIIIFSTQIKTMNIINKTAVPENDFLKELKIDNSLLILDFFLKPCNESC